MGPRFALPWALAIAVVCAASPASALPVLSFVNAPATITTGDTFTIDIGVGLTSSDTSDDVLDLFAFQFGILFDPTLVSAVSTSEGSFLSSGGGTTLFVPGAIDNTAGNITFNAGVLDGAVSGVSGSGILMSLQFLALANGTSAISILLDALNGDGLYDSVGATLGVPIDGVTAQALDLTVGPTEPPQNVPEPGTLLLVGAGAGLAALGRRRLNLRDRA